MRSVWHFASTIFLVVAAACSSGQGLSMNSPNPRRYDILTREDMRDFTNVAEAVSTLRPGWSSSRGCPPGQAVSVFVNRLQSQSANILTGLRPDEASEIRHLSASEAMMRFGGVHPCGAILVLTGA